jgi:predicted CxxxxCH...CXXCH cytochrome family protein
MKKIVRYAIGVMIFFVMTIFTGCSSANKESPFSPDTGHVAGWAIADAHGTPAKTQSNGFASCQTCHGVDFSGGIVNTSCFTCHGVNAPHPSAPWRGAATTHTNTSPGNASVCALCHANGANSSVQPSPPALAGTAPGCFNNTLCHATPGHPAGWNAADQHGASAKSQVNGFSSCEACHGTNFSGGTALTSCFTCHGVNAPHSPAPWRGGVRTHTNTNTGNASVCALCHTNGANSSVQPSPPAQAGTAPGCFNNTLCHAAVGHPAGWADPSQHGVTAEQDFSACKICHGTTYQGGSVTTTCYQCHNGPGLDHPAPAWVVPDHKTAALANITACQKCHGSNYAGGSTHIACTTCHLENETKVHRIDWYPDVRFNHSVYAKANGTTVCSNIYCHGPSLTGVTLSGPSCSTCHVWPLNLSNCITCHGTPPSGTVFPNIAGTHTAHVSLNPNIVCAACHLGAGSGTTDHINGVADVILDPAYNAKSGAAAFSATSFTCSNIICHGGQTTPNWRTGTIDVNTQCSSCHASGTAQYNSYNSGRHSVSAHSNNGCTSCHDTAKLATSHFTNLDPPISATTASATIKDAVNFNGNSCNPSAGGLTGCHGSHTW